MKYMDLKKIGYTIALSLGLVGMIAIPVGAAATTPATTTTGTTAKSSAAANAAAAKQAAQAAAQQARVQRIIARGNGEIARRLVTLNTLSGTISSATKLTAADAETLNNTVNTDISTLNSLQTKLDAETTVTGAITDAQSIILSYRVYVLVVPQVHLIKAADDQQVTEGKLSALSTKLSARITADSQANKNVATLQSELSDLNAKVAAAQPISSGVESSVIGLQPSDYNTNHSVLGGKRDQLKTAEADIQAAVTDARNIVNGLVELGNS